MLRSLVGSEMCIRDSSILTALVKESLPEDLKLQRPARELLFQCADEFVQLLTSEAAEMCDKAKKSTIVGAHVEQALGSLHFEGYAAHVSRVQTEFTQAQAKRPRMNRKADSGLTSEELERAQQELFAKSRQAYQLALSRGNNANAVCSNQSAAPPGKEEPENGAQIGQELKRKLDTLAKQVPVIIGQQHESDDDDYDNL
eukprot:TRINITY_DN3492_c0_g1_i1.p1 TRINITY_DN3492_c0_g1~~TRINITY_DN3492_c0_g1_i1.p1  ORF type:complete len:200 (+),score=56.39 TRINITY_DN3492_c0_g1_i1:107-706(+)